ncbi:hypothetical protein FJZ28_01565 [Candidatus Peregrinibacteria bacterium]|nr:hypothetical protein [Candidatus Peregrinibacteria bacterium]
MRFFLFLLSAIPATVFAQDPCVGVPGGCTSGGNMLVGYIPVIATVILEIVMGLSILGIVIGGVFYIVNLGDDGRATKGKTAILSSLFGLALALSSQALVSFVVDRSSLIPYDEPHLGVMWVAVESILYVMNILFVLSMLFFAFKMVLSRGESGELDTLRKGLVWSITGAFVMNLAYALANAVLNLGF